MKTGRFCYKTGHLWDIVYVLYKLCTDCYCYTLEWNLERSNYKIFCNAQDILYCNFDHMSSDSFYLSLFFLFGLPVFMVVMWGGHLSVNPRYRKRCWSGGCWCFYLCQHTQCLKEYRILVFISLIFCNPLHEPTQNPTPLDLVNLSSFILFLWVFVLPFKDQTCNAFCSHFE